ncbi:hypothetical protein [Nonomuraea soli]|uniref:HEAT repeat domain-containing protein n=1 Tax=Nonomuraea soli TaxID=1032476 RepID=A0A7W0CS32_9ACTN|nr:hypothetical protein [Nonomuraea soli]MBA2896178.1 hypothetical protein [Nonomuraea soli]
MIDELESLSHPDRCRRLSELARSGEPLPLGELAGGGPYERGIALTLAVHRARTGTGGTDVVVAAVRDPDPRIAARAMRAAAALGRMDALFEVVATGSAAARETVYRVVRGRRDSEAAGALIDVVRPRWGDGEAAVLLPACDGDRAGRLVDELAHAVRNWGAVARAHPDVFLDHAARTLRVLPGSLLREWWERHGAAVQVAARSRPSATLELIEAYWVPEAWPRDPRPLVTAEPDRVIAFLTHPDRKAFLTRTVRDRGVVRRLAVLADDRLAPVARALADDPHVLARLLAGIAPSRRAHLFDVAMTGRDLSEAHLIDEIMDVLPYERRSAEARRMAGTRAVADRPQSRVAVAAFLPYAEAETVVRPWTRRPDAEERALGYRSLIAAAGRQRDPAVLARLLSSMDRLRNEQDPVRQAALDELTRVPPSLFGPEHLPALERLTRDALGARDLSYGTRYSLTRLGDRIFAQGAAGGHGELVEFALHATELLTEHAGRLTIGDLRPLLRRGQEAGLVGRLTPWLRSQAARDEHELALSLARGLGRRGHGLAPLQEALEQATRSRHDGVARAAVRAWLEPPHTREPRAEALIARDPSAAVLPEVFAVLAHRRTDLLGVVLGAQAPTGRFAKVRVLPVASDVALARWTARQRARYAELLVGFATRRAVPDTERAAAIRRLGEVEALRPFLDSGHDLLRRAALTALPWTSSPQDALTLLLERIAGVDAHVAASAAARAARFVPPADLAAPLAAVLAGGKVTARKEAVRLAARFSVPGVVTWDDSQHIDVRRAMASSAAQYLLDRDEGWQVLRRATEEGLADVLGERRPLDLPPAARERYADLLAAAVREQPEKAEVLTALSRFAPFAPRALEILGTLARDLERSRLPESALLALAGLAAGGVGGRELVETIEALAGAHDQPDAEPGRDLPALRRLRSLVTVSIQLIHNRPWPIAGLIAPALPADLGAELLAASVRWEAPDLDAIRPSGVLAALEVGGALAGSAGRVSPSLVLPHARRLAEGPATTALLACALVESCGPRVSWPRPWRDLLRTLRAHPDPEVVYRARQIFTAAEV